MTLHEEIRLVGDQALAASQKMVTLTSHRKNAILSAMADEIKKRRDLLLEANARDVADAIESGSPSAMIERLTLNDKRINTMVQGIQEIIALPDPVGKRLLKRTRPNGIIIEKKSVPIGVIAIIYESRPNVTADAAALCIKSGNAVILRGGKEAIRSNVAIAAALAEGGVRAGLPDHAVQLIKTTEREAVTMLVQMDDRIDVVIPRGGESLIRTVVEQASVPVLKHYKGVCHVYIDAKADLNMALNIVENAKCQRPGTCNAAEITLVHAAIAETFLPLINTMAKRRGLIIRADEKARKIVPDFEVASETDWDAEFLDMIMSLKIVENLDCAIKHINCHGSRHSDAIITADRKAARRFLNEVDSAAVFVNASTRLHDGFEFGMGAEMGISTDKLHARGPMGLAELTSYKYVITGTGQLRS